MSEGVAEGRQQVYRLLQCIHERSTMKIEKTLYLGVENLINFTEPKDGVGALHVAVSANNQDIVAFLLSKGANPDIQDKKGRTAVMLAAELGNDNIVSLLAQSHASFSLQDTKGKGVLFYCIYPTERHTRCLEEALKCQAEVNNVSAEGVHVFQLTCENAQECPAMCLMMLDGGADPNATNQKTGVTALIEAAKADPPQLVTAILKRGGNPNALDKRRSTALHYAAKGGYFQVIQVLSAYSADMGVINVDECTPLHYAAATGDANLCKFLAQRGCNPKLKNQEGLLPFQIAKDAGHKAAAKELKKAQMQKGDNKETTEDSLMSDLWVLNLHDWCHVNEAELLQAFGNESDSVTTERLISVLEELKAPVELDQLTKVISVLDKENEDCVNIDDFIKGVKYIKKPFLLSSYMPKKKKGEKEAKGGKREDTSVPPVPICTPPQEHMPRQPDGGPPLYMIEKYVKNIHVSRFDRDHPPEHPKSHDWRGYMKRPEKEYVDISYCVRSGDLESLDLAFTQGVPVDVQDQFYNTPLMVACSSGNYEVAQYLLSRGADVNTCDQFLWTPLHLAAYAGHVELIKLLVEAWAPIDARALNGGTPLMRAIQGCNLSCVDFLLKAGASVDAKTKKEQTCLDVANDIANSRIIDFLKETIESPLIPEEDTKEDKAKKTTPAKKLLK